MIALPSLITSYFGNKGAEDEEISKMNNLAAKGIWEQGRFNLMGKLSLGPEEPSVSDPEGVGLRESI
jgi:hypothetical protein